MRLASWFCRLSELFFFKSAYLIHVSLELLVFRGCCIERSYRWHAGDCGFGDTVAFSKLGLHHLGKTSDKTTVPSREDCDDGNTNKGQQGQLPRKHEHENQDPNHLYQRSQKDLAEERKFRNLSWKLFEIPNGNQLRQFILTLTFRVT